MSEFKPGDRVKVEYEGVFERDSAIPGYALLQSDAGGQRLFVPLSALSMLAPPWQVGDVVAIGLHVMRRADSEPNASWWCTCGGRHNDAQVETDWRNGDVEVLRHRDSS